MDVAVVPATTGTTTARLGAVRVARTPDAAMADGSRLRHLVSHEGNVLPGWTCQRVQKKCPCVHTNCSYTCYYSTGADLTLTNLTRADLTLTNLTPTTTNDLLKDAERQ